MGHCPLNFQMPAEIVDVNKKQMRQQADQEAESDRERGSQTPRAASSRWQPRTAFGHRQAAVGDCFSQWVLQPEQQTRVWQPRGVTFRRLYKRRLLPQRPPGVNDRLPRSRQARTKPNCVGTLWKPIKAAPIQMAKPIKVMATKRRKTAASVSRRRCAPTPTSTQSSISKRTTSLNDRSR